MQNITPTDLSMANYLERRYHNLKPELAFNAGTRDEWLAWRRALSAKLLALLGEFPAPCMLDARTVERVEEESYIREKVLYQSEPGVYVPAYLLIPKDLKPGERRPAVVALHGHGSGKDSLVGLSTEANPHNDYASRFAEHGYVVIAPDARGFGERSEGFRRYGGRDGCNVAFIQAILMGVNLVTLNISDDMRAVDYLTGRPEVDPSRIGCAGLSFGGTRSMYLAALDERIKVALISCYLTTFKAYAIDKGNFCGSQFVPHLLKYADVADVTALIAPRPLLIENGIEDRGFPVEASRDAYQILQRTYAAAGVPDRLERDEFEGGHEFSGRLAFDWFKRWL